MRIDFENVQGLVPHLYRRPIARHLLFRFGGRAGARAFVRGLLPDVTMAAPSPNSASDPLVNLGITYPGLEALDVEAAALEELSPIFREGPDPFHLGDAEGSRSAAENWWEAQFRTEDVHCVVHLYVGSDDALQTASAHVRELAQAAGVTELIPRRDGTVLDGRSLGRGRLHFGYTDGISHPDIAWDDASRTSQQVDFRNFLLGYTNGAQSSTAPIVRDGAYAAFRWIYQDVATFSRFLRTEGPRLFPELAQAHAEELLAAKMLGRWRDGTPLVLSPDRPNPALATSNDFGYGDDPHGHRCPFSAHIRVVNPRDQQLGTVAAAEGVPPVLRRGMPYGPVLHGTEDDGRDRGIIGLFVCSDLRAQVYKLTGWIKCNDFSPVYDQHRRVQDALVANRSVPGAAKEFIIPGERGEASVTLPDFVHTKGTAFLLYPSKTGLQQLSVRS